MSRDARIPGLFVYPSIVIYDWLGLGYKNSRL